MCLIFDDNVRAGNGQTIQARSHWSGVGRVWRRARQLAFADAPATTWAFTGRARGCDAASDGVASSGIKTPNARIPCLSRAMRPIGLVISIDLERARCPSLARP